MIDVSIRLRRAIYKNDVALVRRIIRANPSCLRNPDFEDKSNTSLHVAAQHGFVEIAEVLLDAEHDEDEISRNSDWDTPLMLAASHGQVEVGRLLIERCPRCIPWPNKRGMDALSLAARSPASAEIIPLLLSHPIFPASSHARDSAANTPLHHASAAGSLKALRILLHAGADPSATNAEDWTPLAYSQTVAAEVYFKNLIAEVEKERAAGERSRELERERADSQSTTQSLGNGAPGTMILGIGETESPILTSSPAMMQGGFSGAAGTMARKRPVGGVRLITSDDPSTMTTTSSTNIPGSNLAAGADAYRPSSSHGLENNNNKNDPNTQKPLPSPSFDPRNSMTPLSLFSDSGPRPKQSLPSLSQPSFSPATNTGPFPQMPAPPFAEPLSRARTGSGPLPSSTTVPTPFAETGSMRARTGSGPTPTLQSLSGLRASDDGGAGSVRGRAGTGGNTGLGMGMMAGQQGWSPVSRRGDGAAGGGTTRGR